jgi:hypothetical protein
LGIVAGRRAAVSSGQICAGVALRGTRLPSPSPMWNLARVGEQSNHYLVSFAVLGCPLRARADIREPRTPPKKSLLPLLRIQSQPSDHLVCRLCGVKQTFSLFGTCDWKQSRIEQSNLYQKRPLIPVDMFVRNATGFVETHHDDMWQHNLPTCRRHARKVGAHFAVVSKADNQLVDDTILTDSARQRLDVNVVRPMANEMVAIEARPSG